MEQQSNVKKQKEKKKLSPETITDSSLIQKNANLESKLGEPDYSSMKAAIEKVSDPVSFEALKEFYGLE